MSTPSHPARSTAIAVAVFLALASTFLVPVSAWAKWIPAHISEFAPLQMELGKALARKVADQWVEEAKAVVRATGQNPESSSQVRLALLRIIDYVGNRGYEGYRLPDGVLRSDDGHHKIEAIRILMEEYDIPDFAVVWKVRVKPGNDFSHLKGASAWQIAAKSLRARNIGIFPSEMVEAYKKEFGPRRYLAELYKALPHSFPEIGDSPIRSALGFMFQTLDLKGGEFAAGIQSDLGDALVKDGFEIKPGQEFAGTTQAKLQAKIFDLSNQLFSNILLRGADASAAGKVRSVIQKRGALVEQAKNEQGELCQCFLNLIRVEIKPQTEFPKNLELPSNKEEFSGFINRAQERFGNQVELNKVDGYLRTLAAGERLGRPEINYLRDSRKYAVAVRSAYELFSPAKAPGGFRTFTRDLGSLDEDLKSGQLNSEEGRALIAAKAQKLRETLKSGSPLLSDFEGKEPDKFEAAQKKRLDWIDETLALSRETAKGKAKDLLKSGRYLPVERYHDLRKFVRDYKALFNLLSEQQPFNLKYRSAAIQLESLSKHMGTVKDGLLRQGDSALAKRLRKMPVLQRPTVIDPDTLKAIKDFVAQMRGGL